jgi:hypothetical protein
VLNRHKAIELLGQVGGPLRLEHEIPPVHGVKRADERRADSQAELDFHAVCVARNFPPPPAQQYRVTLPDGTTTIADWAYPEKRVLIYIDGMSKEYHGSSRQAHEDNLLRAKLRMAGYNVVAITAEALKDDASVSAHLEELSIYLGGS